MANRSEIPSISNTASKPTLASHIDTDIEYIRGLGPGPLPWEDPAKELDCYIKGNGGYKDLKDPPGNY